MAGIRPGSRDRTSGIGKGENPNMRGQSTRTSQSFEGLRDTPSRGRKSPYRTPGRDPVGQGRPEEGPWLIGIALLVVMVFIFALLGQGVSR